MGKLETLNANLNTIKSNIPLIYEAGKKAQYELFWDIFQDYGSRTNYDYAFYYLYWKEDNFCPKYDLTIKSGQRTFGFLNQSGIAFNFGQKLIDCGVTLDTSLATNLVGLFYYAYVDNIPTINTSNCSAINAMFTYCKETVTIQKLILKSDGTQTFLGNPFRYCDKLQNIVIEGTIGNNGIDLRESTSLSGDSIESFINALSQTTSGLVITFSQTAVDNAIFSSGKTWSELVSSRSNWTITLV